MRRWAAVSLITTLLFLVLASPVEAQGASSQGGRPVLPNEQVYGTTHFSIHYTLTSDAAVNPTDDDNSGVPDYVEKVGQSLEFTWDFQVNQLGWVAPLFDHGEGGDERIDVYLENQLADGYAGYVETGAGYVGDNPNTREAERNAAYGFMSLDNDYIEVLKDGTGETPEQLMHATVAHEFHHLVQAAYDDNDPHFWLYEATATWMEDEVYDDVNDGVWYLDAVFKSPDTCLVSEGGTIREEDDGRWYGAWLLLRHMSEQYGHGIVRTIWEQSRRLNGFDSIDAALAPHGSSLVDQSRSFAVANLLRAYEEGAEYPTVQLAGTVERGQFVPPDGVQSLGADYVELRGSGTVAVTLGASRAPLFLQAVGVRGSQADVYGSPNGQLVLNLDAYDSAYLIVHNDEMLTYESDCYFADYTISVEPSTAPPAAVTAQWPANNYRSPGTQAVYAGESGAAPYDDVPYRSDDQGSFAESPTALPVNFEVLVPLTLPPGYEFDYAYILTAEELGDNSVFYVPGGGDSANFDYLDAEENWLSIAESPSPYADVREWIDAINYSDTPGEIRTISGIEVLVEDLGDEAGAWYSATFVINDLFIVVDGDNREEDVIFLVQSLIDAAQNPAPAVQPAPAGPIPGLPDIPQYPAPVPDIPFIEETFGTLSTLTLVMCCGGLCVVAGGALVAVGMVLRRRER